MINTAYALSAYTQTKVTTSVNPIDLVIMLYDGAVEFLEKASTAILMKEVEVKIKYVNKSLAILDELSSTLNMEQGGEVASNLQGLYDYMMTELVRANLKGDTEAIRNIISMLKDVREAWAEIKDKA